MDENHDKAWQESIPEVAWGTIALFVAIIASYILTIWAAVSGRIPYWLTTVICGYLCYASFTVMHDAGHGSIIKIGSKLKPLEVFLGWAASLPLLIAPYRAFQRIHDRHHAFTNDPERDPDHFEYTESWAKVMISALAVPFRYHWMMFTKLRHIKVIRETYPTTFLYFAFVGSTLWALTRAGYGTEVVSFGLIPVLIATLLLATFFDYIPHHPHRSLDPYHGTRIYPGPLLNLVLLGQNYHLIHHLYPRVPWYLYQPLFKRIRPELEAKGAPIEDVLGLMAPGLLHSPNPQLVKASDRTMKRVLAVSSIERDCDDAVSIQFRLPDHQVFEHKPGQFVVISKWLEGRYVSRSYSVCSKPGDKHLAIGVRRAPDGLMSCFLNDELRVGQELVVEGPFGGFTYSRRDYPQAKNLALVAGGSGITPMLSIIEAALAEPDGPAIHLVYANRRPETAMFLDHLKQLAEKRSNRLRLSLNFSEGGQRLAVEKSLEEADLYYVCGPDGLNDAVKAHLENQGVQENRILTEQFVSRVTEPIGELHKVQLTLPDHDQVELEVAGNQTVLEVAKEQGIQLPYACESGNCGTCKCRVEGGVAPELSGSITGLSENEIAQGYTLACQARPQGMVELRVIHF